VQSWPKILQKAYLVAFNLCAVKCIHRILRNEYYLKRTMPPP